MNAALSRELLGEVTARILEEAAFVFTQQTESPPDFEGDVVESRIGLSGPVHGEVLIASSAQFAHDLAANLLGVDPDDDTARANRLDALGEILNIIGGALLEELSSQAQATPEHPARLGLPSVAAVAPAAHEERRQSALLSVAFVTEEGHRLDALFTPSKGA